MAELAASNTCTQAVVADTDSIIFERICKVVAALGHGTNKDADALLGRKIGHVVADSDNGSIET